MSHEILDSDNEAKSYDFSVFFPMPTLSAITEVKRDESYERVVLQEIDFLSWSTKIVDQGLEVFGISPNSHVAWRFKSPLLESVKSGKPDDQWIDSVSTFINSFNEGDPGMTLHFNGRVAAYLSRIEQHVGIQSYDILLNHGAFIFRAVTRRASNGMFIVGLSSKKDYCAWESPYNKRLSPWQEEKMIDNISDWVDEIVLDPAAA